DLRNPNDVGSGGGGFNGDDAGNGGGVIRIVGQTLVLNGAIRSHGGPPASGFSAGGSGGGIRIDVGTLSGAGSISANGSAATPSGGGGGGGGRIAIYYENATTFNLITQITAAGGVGSSAPNGQSGTIHMEQRLAISAPAIDQAPVMK